MPATSSWKPGPRGQRCRFGRSLVAVVGVLSVIALAACSGSSSSSNGENADAGVLRLGAVGLDTADPATVVPTSQIELIAADLLYDGLTTTDPRTAEVEPALATSWDWHEGSGEPGAPVGSWTFHLRDGATFSDGTPVTAADVKASLERIARIGATSVAGARLNVIVGYGEVASGAAKTISGVRAPDDRTVEIDLGEAYSQLPTMLSAPDYGVLPASAPAPASSTEAGSARQDVGGQGSAGSSSHATGTDTGTGDAPRSELVPSATSGPYRVASSDGGSLRVERVDDSSEAPATITFKRFDTLEQSFDAFVGDELDWSLVPTGSLSDASALGDQFQPTPFQAEVWFGFNLTDPTYQQPALRQAITRAVDRTRIVHDLLPGRVGLNGTVVEGVPGALADACGDSCKYDPDASRSLLASAYPDGAIPTVRIDTYDDPTLRSVVEAIKSDIEAVGIKVEVKELPFADYRAVPLPGSAQIFVLGWVGIAPIADSYVGPLFLSDAPDNSTGFSSAEVDAAIHKARAVTDAGTRTEQYQAIERQIMGQVPLVPIAQFQTNQVVATSRVSGWATRLDGTFDVAAVRRIVAGA